MGIKVEKRRRRRGGEKRGRVREGQERKETVKDMKKSIFNSILSLTSLLVAVVIPPSTRDTIYCPRPVYKPVTWKHKEPQINLSVS